jgi:hypothetical protein
VRRSELTQDFVIGGGPHPHILLLQVIDQHHTKLGVTIDDQDPVRCNVVTDQALTLRFVMEPRQLSRRKPAQ